MPLKGYIQTEEHRKKAAEGKRGKHYQTVGSRRLISEKQRGEKGHNWLGEKATYKSIHVWINNQFGRPTTCEQCGKKNLTGKKIHWANISKKYLRDRNDWKRLCQKCHSQYDEVPQKLRKQTNENYHSVSFL